MEISKAKFMRKTGLSRTRYAEDLTTGLIPAPIKTAGGQYRHLEQDIEIYKRNRLRLNNSVSEKYQKALSEIKPIL